MVDIPEEIVEKRPNRRFIVPLVLLASGVMGIGFLFHWVKSPKPIQKIVFQGLVVLKPADLVEYLGVPSEGMNQEIKGWNEWEKKLNLHPRIKLARVNRDREGILIITLQEKVAEFVVHVGDMIYEVDKDKEILSENNVLADHLIVISGSFPITSNKIQGTQFSDLSSELHSGLESYPALKTRISEVSLEQDGDYMIYLKSPSHAKVFLGNKFDLYQIRKLYAALSFLESENIKVSTIDLRGEDAVYH
ncbi:cell division protein [Leptospira ognonensis]|uniref:Cell division protein n=2 Tax=Leptospira ognonensis TaxID=2484945 RepID=A0A4R9JUQ4_9LEPT|nr:cell division protein [Leptospira ognonensis]